MDLVALMHADYLAGLSIAEVADKYDKHRQNVHEAFRRRGLAMRDRLAAVRDRAKRMRQNRVRAAPQKRLETEREAFDRQVERCGQDDCWPWRGNTNSNGYGTFSFNGVRRGAHRVALEMSGAFIPDGYLACHHCDNPPCCNPRHLYVGTHHTNSMDAWNRGRIKPVRGEAASSSILTAERVRAIRRVASSDRTTPRMKLFARLAAEHGVAITTVQGAVNRCTWRHVK